MRNLICVLAFALPASAQKKDPLPELNAKVLKYAQAQKGKQVGDGECGAFAAAAIADAGATLGNDNGVAVWGKKIGEKEAILPGDVITFKEAKFPYGGGLLYFPQHTAIVAKVEGKKVTLLHANVMGKKTVQAHDLRLDLKKEGSFEVFRPQPPG